MRADEAREANDRAIGVVGAPAGPCVVWGGGLLCTSVPSRRNEAPQRKYGVAVAVAETVARIRVGSGVPVEQLVCHPRLPLVAGLDSERPSVHVWDCGAGVPRHSGGGRRGGRGPLAVRMARRAPLRGCPFSCATPP